MSKAEALYDSFGGERALETIVERFYGKVVSDPLLALYFKRTDLFSLKRRFQKYLVCLLLDNETAYEGPSMYQAHAGRGVTDEAADLFLEKFREALVEADVTAVHIEKIMEKLAPVKDVVEDKVVFQAPHVYRPDSARDKVKGK